jgi:hypothetical protein
MANINVLLKALNSGLSPIVGLVALAFGFWLLAFGFWLLAFGF